MTEQPTQLEPMADEQTLAALWRGGGDARTELPPALRAKLIREAPSHLPKPMALSGVSWVAWSGWAAAAAVLVISLVYFATRPEPQIAVKPDDPPVEQPVTFASFRATTDAEPATLGVQAMGDAYDGAQAEVIWDDTRQAGVLRVRDLPVNDAAQAQYQLWIVDATRPDDNGRNRVDGGVFDVTQTDGWSEIVINGKLPVGEAVGFAITLEPPGGSVVSELGPRLLMITG
ncbi:MAG: anti-sigma factor [Planctomycetota bacterium]